MTEEEFDALIQSLLMQGYTVEELEASAEQDNFEDEFGISLPNFAIDINAQTAIQGAAQKANSSYRTANRIKKAQCNRSGGFNVGSGGNHQCLRGEDAVAHIEGIGENAPAYERAQEWLAEYNAEQGIDEDTTAEGDPFGAYVVDTDGDGFVDTVQGTNPYGETVLVQGNDGLNAEIQAAQDLKDSIYNQEGWDDLEEWEQDRALINAGGSAIHGTDGNAPEETTEPTGIEAAIENMKEKFPTFDDVWNAVVADLPSNPQEWGDVIRSVLEAAGVDLPSADIYDILNGGYGVIADIDPSTGGITGIFDPANQDVFVPGVIPGGEESTIIGSVEDIINAPADVVKNKIEEVLSSVQDPEKLIKVILNSGLDIPPQMWEVLTGAVAAGSELLDWIQNAMDNTDEDGVVIGQTEEPEDTTEEPEDSLGFGHEGGTSDGGAGIEPGDDLDINTGEEPEITTEPPSVSEPPLF